jgi:hypothetical protein
METFIELRNPVANPYFHKQKQRSLNNLDISELDSPIVELIRDMNRLDYCFTLQSCYGHFLHKDQKDPQNLEPLPVNDSISEVEYRISYIAMCIDNNDSGRNLFNDLKKITTIDPDYIQFGCSTWFWERQINSYALQVEPKRYMTKDSVIVNYREALHIQRTRSQFFTQLSELVKGRMTNG